MFFIRNLGFSIIHTIQSKKRIFLYFQFLSQLCSDALPPYSSFFDSLNIILDVLLI